MAAIGCSQDNTFFRTSLCSYSTKAKKGRCGMRCSSIAGEENKFESRRSISISLILLNFFSKPKYANAGSFDKYIKRKKLDPLESYIPAVLLARLQFLELEKTLDVENPEYSNSRSLLRYGPAASLRVNMRAVAQYAIDDGRGKAAFDDVNKCLRALEDLDSLLLHASRNDPKASVETMKAKIVVALNALDSLLETVPPAVLDKGKAMAQEYDSTSSTDSGESDTIDPEIKQLESLL